MPEPLRWNMRLHNGELLRWNMGPQYRWNGTVPETSNTYQNMSLPNITVPFPEQNITDIKDGLIALRAKFPVWAQVGPDERKKLNKIEQGRDPYVSEAFTDAKANPATVPGTVDIAKWELEEKHHRALDVLESAYAEELEVIRGLKAVTGHYRYDKTLRFYDYLGGNLDVLTGAKTIYDKIAGLFAKQGNRKPKPTGGTGGNP
jgi:hypothetical protein